MPQTNTPELWSLCFVRTSWTGPDGFVAYFARDQKDADERKARFNAGERDAITWADRDKYSGAFMALLCGLQSDWFTGLETIDGVERLITLRKLAPNGERPESLSPADGAVVSPTKEA